MIHSHGTKKMSTNQGRIGGKENVVEVFVFLPDW